LAGLAAALLAAGDVGAALDAAQLAITRARATERGRIDALANLIIGAALRRADRAAEARAPLDAARGAAARTGDSTIAGLSLIELAWLDLADGSHAAAATCLEFAAEFLRRAGRPEWAVEADAFAIVALADAGDLDAATARAGATSDAARAIGRDDLIAWIDGALADLTLAHARDAATEACALAAETAHALPDSPLARELVARARLRQVRATVDAHDRARHLEAGIEIALTLPREHAGARLGGLLIALVDDGIATDQLPARAEIARLADAIATLDDAELSAIAAGVLADL
jgi:hypothetical protein